ncbi:hypothetical protein C8R44DRAFT_643573, partial [Mycena epipterygia]
VYPEQLGGKPVIYIYSPVDIDIAVSLTLIRDWSFSTIYPVVPAKSPFSPSGVGQRILWNVRTHPDGSLIELNTDLDVTYLFWEAQYVFFFPPNHEILISPPGSPVLDQPAAVESFSPLTCDLSPSDSVLLQVSDITPYLDNVLRALGLHTEARTSFITYWLPSFLKHTYIALRFVPQAAYETAAPLDIMPAPDVITRVFMLFKGVSADAAVGAWGASRPAKDDPVRWRNVVGVDADRAADTALLRVLEWGGMEVLAR